jgi:hypothetical protein
MNIYEYIKYIYIIYITFAEYIKFAENIIEINNFVFLQFYLPF